MNRRCFRCGGLKTVYKTAVGYSAVNMGGIKMDCPLCNGKGVMDIKLKSKKAEKKRPYKKKSEEKV